MKRTFMLLTLALFAAGPANARSPVLPTCGASKVII
jgi:hypothetical protein